ncbi:B3 DNA binding domain [Macleaya cordata]|uniref:B3 DNA binding domain n=1 Tax=Macleaya cordata TaxID=56857 RepID=A0A200QJ44_MACCD|nr:B3 DNA binding domain [Macleaya cordata]
MAMEFQSLIPKEEMIWSDKSTEDQMTLAQLSQAKRSSSTTPKPDSLSMVVADPVRKSTSSKKKRSLIEVDKANLSAQERAEEIQSSLDPEFPSFVKLMLRSHVTGGFWLGLPSQFCYANLPKQDVSMTLLDENGEAYTTKFLAEKCGLSGGWRGFSIAHKLVEGDALVFHLVKITKFKVYIVRRNGLAEVDGALGLLKLDAHAKGSEVTKTTKSKKPAMKRQKSLPSAVCQGNDENVSPPLSGSDQPENHSEEVDSEVLEGNQGIKFSGSVVEFQDIKNLESFTITVNGLIINSEIFEHVRTKYYELCRSQNCFLHKHLVQGLNCKLVAGIISETVNIADAIRASKLSTPRDEFAIWDKCLKAFKQLGMNVDFLLSRLEQLVNLVFESEEALDSKKYREAMIGKTRAEEEIKTLEMNLIELKDALKKFETDIKTLQVKAEMHELTFQAEVDAPW